MCVSPSPPGYDRTRECLRTAASARNPNPCHSGNTILWLLTASLASPADALPSIPALQTGETIFRSPHSPACFGLEACARSFFSTQNNLVSPTFRILQSRLRHSPGEPFRVDTHARLLSPGSIQPSVLLLLLLIIRGGGLAWLCFPRTSQGQGRVLRAQCGERVQRPSERWSGSRSEEPAGQRLSGESVLTFTRVPWNLSP